MGEKYKNKLLLMLQGGQKDTATEGQWTSGPFSEGSKNVAEDINIFFNQNEETLKIILQDDAIFLKLTVEREKTLMQLNISILCLGKKTNVAGRLQDDEILFHSS